MWHIGAKGSKLYGKGCEKIIRLVKFLLSTITFFPVYNVQTYLPIKILFYVWFNVNNVNNQSTHLKPDNGVANFVCLKKGLV